MLPRTGMTDAIGLRITLLVGRWQMADGRQRTADLINDPMTPAFAAQGGATPRVCKATDAAKPVLTGGL
jgi:hypothetical protein